MNILIVSQYFWPETFRINDLACSLQKMGHQVTVLTGKPNYPQGRFFAEYGFFKKNRENYHGVKIIRVPLIPRGKSNKLLLILNYLSFAFFASLFAPFVCRNKVDVIFVYEPSPITVGLPAILLSKIKQAPILFWSQDLWPETLSATGSVRSKRILNWVNKLVHFIYQRCDKILVQSKAFIPSIKQHGISAERILYFPNTAEDIYTNEDINITANLEVLPAGFRIVYAGNIGVSQSLQTVLEAAILLREHPKIHWIVIGEGNQKDWLVKQILAHGLTNIHLIPQQPLEHMPYYLKEADALLVSLKEDPVFALTIPTKLQSALACGRPIIASLNGEAAQIVKEAGAGLVSPAENAQYLAENVLMMYNTPLQVRQEMGNKGRLYFETHFEKKKLLAQLETWMMEVVKEHNQSSRKNETFLG